MDKKLKFRAGPFLAGNLKKFKISGVISTLHPYNFRKSEPISMPFGYVIAMDRRIGANLVSPPAVVRSAGGAGGKIRKIFFWSEKIVISFL